GEPRDGVAEILLLWGQSQRHDLVMREAEMWRTRASAARTDILPSYNTNRLVLWQITGRGRICTERSMSERPVSRGHEERGSPDANRSHPSEPAGEVAKAPQ